MSTSRRSFLKCAAASVAVPFVLPSDIWSAETKPNAKVGMGFIGMGKQNGGLLGGFLGQDTQVLAVCDVDTTRREAAKKRVDDYYSRPEEQAGGLRRPTTTSARSSTARTSTPSASPRPTTGTRSSRWPRCGPARTSIAKSR